MGGDASLQETAAIETQVAAERRANRGHFPIGCGLPSL
jgi:hypothetical protein